MYLVAAAPWPFWYLKPRGPQSSSSRAETIAFTSGYLGREALLADRSVLGHDQTRVTAFRASRSSSRDTLGNILVLPIARHVSVDGRISGSRHISPGPRSSSLSR